MNDYFWSIRPPDVPLSGVRYGRLLWHIGKIERHKVARQETLPDGSVVDTAPLRNIQPVHA
jgi:hypothetical protein